MPIKTIACVVDSAQAARKALAAEGRDAPPGAAWVLDPGAGTVRCPSCAVTAYCAARGHDWTSWRRGEQARRPASWPARARPSRRAAAEALLRVFSANTRQEPATAGHHRTPQPAGPGIVGPGQRGCAAGGGRCWIRTNEACATVLQTAPFGRSGNLPDSPSFADGD
jgi:hypothetical protein